MSRTTTQEISRSEWPLFFDAVSRQHERWLVTVEVFSADAGAQIAATSLRFEGISADLKGREDSIAITLGEEADAHLTHVIRAPTHVRLETSDLDRGTFETLEIESAEGSTTLVRFLAGVLPEMLDGIVEPGDW